MKDADGGDHSPPSRGRNKPSKSTEILDGIERRLVQSQGTTPEQALFGCLIGIGVLVVTALVWLSVYWYYNPEFHEHPAPLPQILAPTPKPRIMHVFHFPTNNSAARPVPAEVH